MPRSRDDESEASLPFRDPASLRSIGLRIAFEDQIPRDYDPTKGFHRARQKAAPLHASMDGWDGSLPVPKEVMMAARELVAAHGHEAAGQWEEYRLEGEIEHGLAWPESPDVPHDATGAP